jgi:multiple sugar transport system permease protein
MTDSANGTPADETPEVDASEHATLEKAIEEALDELPEAQLEEFVEETDDQEATEAAAAPKRWRLWRRKGDDGPTDEDTDDADDDADDDEFDDADADDDDDADDDESDDADADAGDEHDDEADDDEEDDEGEDADEDYDDSAVAKRQRRLRRRRSYAPAGRVERNPWVYLGPLVGILVLLTLLPLVRLIVASLFERSLTAPDDTSFSHVRNFLDVLSARDWWLAVALTLVVVTVAVLAQLLLGAAFAGTLRRITFGGPWVQVLLLVPFVLMPAAVATAWRDGWVDGFATAWFRVDPGGGQLTALATLLSHEVWRGTGITTVILLAGLSRVKPSLLDATIADGATARQRLTQVVLPAVAPAVAVVALYRSLDALRSIEAPVLTAGELGDLSTASQLMWTTSFTDFEVGLGAAMALLLIVLAAGLGLLLTLLMQVRRTL